jgi:hypothetical protein
MFLISRSLRALRGVGRCAIVLGVLAAVCSTSYAQIIFDNCSSLAGTICPNGMVTRPGAGPGGADLSVLITPDNILGFGHAGGIRLVDDFTIPAGQTWNITGAGVFGYTTGAAAPTTTTAVMRILDASPVGAFNVLAGDLTTNTLQAGSNVFANINRVTTTTLADVGRRVQSNILNFGAPVMLGPGTYWFEYGVTTTTGSGFVPPLQVVPEAGAVVTGNAIQFGTTMTYAPITDSGSFVAKGIPFQIRGTVVPEPTSFALITIAFGALCLSARRGNR